MPKPIGSRSNSVTINSTSKTVSAKLMGPPAEPPQGRPAPPSGGGERSELGGPSGPPAEPPQGRPASPSGGGERSELGGPAKPPLQLLFPAVPEQAHELDDVAPRNQRDEQEERREDERKRDVEHRRLFAAHEAHVVESLGQQHEQQPRGQTGTHEREDALAARRQCRVDEVQHHVVLFLEQ